MTDDDGAMVTRIMKRMSSSLVTRIMMRMMIMMRMSSLWECFVININVVVGDGDNALVASAQPSNGTAGDMIASS